MAESAFTQFVTATNHTKYAYRRFGQPSEVPIVLHIHFRGNMDHWDPLLVNSLAQKREVILFDNAGVGRSSGEVPSTFAEWAKDMIAFIRALGLVEVDLFGFSMGGLAVLEAALAAPGLVRKLIIAGSRASIPFNGSVDGIVWPQDTSDPKFVTALASAVSVEEGREALKYSCFPQTQEGALAADAYWRRLLNRTAEPTDLVLLPMDKGGSAQVTSIMDADVPQSSGSFNKLGELKMPVLVMNGDNDVLIPTSRSWELFRRIDNAQLVIYPRSGHGFLWQYAEKVGKDVNGFLDGIESGQ